MVLLLGCLVSLVTAGSVSLRLFAAGASNALFVPLLEIGVLAGLWRGKRAVGFSRTVDLFFMGHGPWVLVAAGILRDLGVRFPDSGLRFDRTVDVVTAGVVFRLVGLH